MQMSTNSDDNGQYVFTGLPPGVYKVYIHGFTALTSSLHNGLHRRRHSSTDALVEITKDNEIHRGVDLDVYHARELSSIAGKVSGGENLPNFTLHVLATSQNGVLRAYALVDMDSGEFLLKDLPPGYFTIKLMLTKQRGGKAAEVSSKKVHVKPKQRLVDMDFSFPSFED